MSLRMLKHPILGFGAGAASGGLMTAAVFAFNYAITPLPGLASVPEAQRVAGFATSVFVIATIIWSLGLLVIGCPVWTVLENRGVRGPLIAILFGTFAVYGVSLLWPPSSWTGAIDPSRIMLAISGGLVGLVIERVAYRSTKKS
ncbi:hypothetical protein ACETK8_02840 [Brevundimonas staleyi]|uniref:Uncharacterized protein n=1 Tax=Brevundimonas staleyi TaxID=74326 RepID=A0ABW0FU35_9CAUL